jgi:TPR repeat protein
MKNIIVLNLLSLVGIILLSGCASSEPQTGGTSKQSWYQAGISAEQTRRDLADCQNEALVNGRSFSPIPAQDAGASIALGMLASSSEKSRQNQIVQTCMAAKGYSLVNTNSPLLTNSQPTQAQQSAADFKLFEDIKVKAEGGNAIAQYNLGYCYEYGRGVAKDYGEAAKWYAKQRIREMPMLNAI